MASTRTRPVEPSGNGQPEPVEKAAPTGQIGVQGLSVASGRPRDEFHPKLRGDRAARTFREMADNDAVVGGILFAIDMTLRRTEWRVEPNARAVEGGQEAEAGKWADHVQSCLHDMSLPWDQTVSGILSFLPFGWSLFELVYKKRGGDVEDPRFASAFDDGLWGWRKFDYRAQESLLRWEWDEDGELDAFVQRDPNGAQPIPPIPFEKFLLFRTTTARGNPEGRSILRNAYRSWYLKKRIEEIEGIGIERDLAGIPIAMVPPSILDADASPNEKLLFAAMERIVRDIKRDEQAGLIFPKELDENGRDKWELKLLTTGGTRQIDTDPIVARYDQRIAMTVLADFILLGHEKVGSKALGVSKVELFTKALEAFLDEIKGVVNQYAIPRLLKLNGADRKLSPQLAYNPVERADLAELGAYVRDITGAGVGMDEGLDRYLREEGGMPPPEGDPEAGEEVE